MLENLTTRARSLRVILLTIDAVSIHSRFMCVAVCTEKTKLRFARRSCSCSCSFAHFFKFCVFCFENNCTACFGLILRLISVSNSYKIDDFILIWQERRPRLVCPFVEAFSAVKRVAHRINKQLLLLLLTAEFIYLSRYLDQETAKGPFRSSS